MKFTQASLTLIAAILAAAPGWTFQSSAVTDWIRTNAIALKTTEPGESFDDLKPLKSIVGNARIVSLGEATHGSREFFQLKHRMLEFLATEMGFTMLSIEANMPEAYRLNDYVLTGKGDPAMLLKGLYYSWIWDTEEMLALIHWMREFNASGKGRLEFTGFDMQAPGGAPLTAADFIVKYDPSYNSTIAEGMRLLNESNYEAGANFGIATAAFPAAAAAGKKVRYSGWIKTEGVTRGYAGLWWRVDGAPGKSLALDTMIDRGAKGTSDWTRFEIELPVAAEAKNVYFGALLPGNGTAWFDDLEIELDGEPYARTDVFDLSFESDTLRRFFNVGGNGYLVALDESVSHSGKKSLIMSYAGPDVPVPLPVDRNAASAKWKEIAEYMDVHQASFVAKGSSEREAAWAAQNARVVFQCMRMRANQVPRDISMAENIKWIADHSPDAKIVVWAHNAHVVAGGSQYETMGMEMWRTFGAQLVTFGLTFNQGSFQAMNRGELKNFTVDSAKADTLEAALAAPKIPLMAVDLRSLPATGPVAEWFGTPRGSRAITVGYSEGNPNTYSLNLIVPKAFDVMLFVEKTRVARKN